MSNFVVSAELRARLEEMASCSAKAAGTVLFHRGDSVSGVFLIEKGKVKLTLGESEAYPPRKLGPGSVLGLPATLAGAAYSLTAEVIEDAQVGFIPRDTVLDFLRANPLLCFQVTQILGEELSAMRSATELSAEARSRQKAALHPRRRTCKVN